MDDMNELGSWTKGYVYYEHLRVVVDMNDFGLIRSQLVSQLIHVLSMVPDSGAIWYVSSWCPLIVVLRE